MDSTDTIDTSYTPLLITESSEDDKCISSAELGEKEGHLSISRCVENDELGVSTTTTLPVQFRNGKSLGTIKSPNVSEASSSNDEKRKVKNKKVISKSESQIRSLPDEQDRKRIVGCFAAILAFTFSYDEIEDLKGYDGMHDYEIDSTLSRSYDGNEFSNDNISCYSSSSLNSRTRSTKKLREASWFQIKSKNVYEEKSAILRHRKRRHEIYRDLLLLSAEYLLLDKEHAIAFVPMLSRLLNPPANSAFDSYHSQQQHKYCNKEEKNEELDCELTTCLIGEEVEEKDHTPIHSVEGKVLMERYIEDNKTLMSLVNPFLESLSPGSGYRCIALFLLQHLITCPQGYDSRVRFAFKQLSVLVLSNEMKDEFPLLNELQLHEMATRKFEALEHSIAEKLLSLPSPKPVENKKNNQIQVVDSTKKSISPAMKKNILRGLKVSCAGLVAGSIFAVTGGLAAPAIAAGIATISSTAATSAAFATLTSTTAITSIFGFGGGGLAAYKMQRRTKGLTEFNFQKESKGRAELFSTICISGWLKDTCDFQRPWGVKPTLPPITNLQELLERFYFVHKPDNVERCPKILQQWKGQERQLWRILRMKYGRDPDHLFPLQGGPRDLAVLSKAEDESLNVYIQELGLGLAKTKSQFTASEKKKNTADAEIKENIIQQIHDHQQKVVILDGVENSTSSVTKNKFSANSSCNSKASLDMSSLPKPNTNSSSSSSNPLKEPPSHLLSVWDFQSQYSGELYTIKWESDLLLELCDSVTDLAVDIVSGSTREILRHTIVATLISAITIPAALVSTLNIIDEIWSLTMKRTEDAGIELANCLLENHSGHRPVSLVGFSMGSRIIYECLKELARHQEKWEDLREADTQSEQNDDDENIKYSREPASIIEDVVLMGTPNHLSVKSWSACRRVVAGRLINCYSRKDFILSIMFQYKRMSGILRPVCGTSAVPVPV